MLLIVTSSTSTRAADIDDEFVFGILKYKITSENPKTVTLVKYDGDEPSGELVIPATVTYEGNSYSVTAIGDKVFQYCTTLTSVTIPKSVTSIGNYAFQFCANLPFVTIPEGVTSIGESAFYYCSGLISVTIPEGVTSIGRNAFYDVKHIINKSKCTDGRPWGALLENGTIVGDFVYEDDTKVKLLVYIGKGGEVTIPKGVTSIGNIAFSNCTRLT
ncbi:MAG: leucine-rich repeat domain-containing protein, partial [Bacteroidales bacterium]|nr:leucine-rich repeat domain-containing protein [Bacteroidales bacterium]